MGSCETTEEVKRIIINFALETQKQAPVNYHKKKRVIVLSGPTGCGKSSLAISLCQAMGGEIISADSMQVYRGMDIGTAKATKEERMQVAHHLIDIRDIHESFNVVDFYFEARLAIREVLERKNIPIVVGGSGFYLHTLLYGPPSGPPSLPELRQYLEEEIEIVGSEALYLRVQQMDPDYAKTITKHDKQKIVRALEIMTITKEKVSKHSWKGRRPPQNYDFHCWFLHRPKPVLYDRIDCRCDIMLKDGLIAEVEKLIESGLIQNHSALQAIGYRQVLDFLSTSKTESDYVNFVNSFKQATRNYAKRQCTWFRKESLFRWLDVDLHDPEIVFDMIIKDYESR